jgi:uncharacterized LabA/DUF88 family protein
VAAFVTLHSWQEGWNTQLCADGSRHRPAFARQIALFVDGTYAARSETILKRQIDWTAAIRGLAHGSTLHGVRVYAPATQAYAPGARDNTRLWSPTDTVKRVLSSAVAHGMQAISTFGPAAPHATHSRRLPHALAVELTVDAIGQADRITDLALVSGDAMFRRLIWAVQQKGVRVTVIASETRGLVSDSIRRQCDRFLHLDEPGTRFVPEPMRQAHLGRSWHIPAGGTAPC